MLYEGDDTKYWWPGSLSVAQKVKSQQICDFALVEFWKKITSSNFTFHKPAAAKGKFVKLFLWYF